MPRDEHRIADHRKVRDNIERAQNDKLASGNPSNPPPQLDKPSSDKDRRRRNKISKEEVLIYLKQVRANRKDRPRVSGLDKSNHKSILRLLPFAFQEKSVRFQFGERRYKKQDIITLLCKLIGAPAITELQLLCESTDEDIRSKANGVLRRLRPDSFPDKKVPSSKTLEDKVKQRNIRRLKRLCQDPAVSFPKRLDALRAFSGKYGEDVAGLFRESMESSNLSIKQSAVELLPKYPSIARLWIKALCELAESDRSIRLKRAAMLTLGQIAETWMRKSMSLSSDADIQIYRHLLMIPDIQNNAADVLMGLVLGEHEKRAQVAFDLLRSCRDESIRKKSYDTLSQHPKSKATSKLRIEQLMAALRLQQPTPKNDIHTPIKDMLKSKRKPT